MDWSKLLNHERRRPSDRLSSDPRAEFDRDYDRALFSTPVRRLQDKAQVFPLEPNDSVRTRLTHSNEVAAIARTLGFQCGIFIQEKESLPADFIRAIEFICMTCGLVHDIGNPPFGHSGEKAISEWFKKNILPNTHSGFILHGETDQNSQRANDFIKFDGNAQTIRLLTKLQLLTDFYGLNLTYGTLSAVFKYTATSNGIGKGGAKKKMGFFWSENELYAEVSDKTGTFGNRNPLTFLVEAADDIAYGVVDIEDGIKKCVVTWDQIISDKKHGAVLKPIYEQALGKVAKGEVTLTGREHENAVAVWFRTLAIGRLVPSMVSAFKDNYEAIMHGQLASPLEEVCSEKDLIAACKHIGLTYIYFSPQILQLEIMGRQVIHDLMSEFWEGASSTKVGPDILAKNFPEKLYLLMSANYRRVFENELKKQKGAADPYHTLQLVTDYVCGMTDTFIIELHRKLKNG